MAQMVLDEEQEQIVPSDTTRQIDKDTLNSFNLKIENNLDDYIVVTVNGNKDNDVLFDDLKRIVYNDRVRAFTEPDQACTFALEKRECGVKIFLIISGKLGQLYAHQFADDTNILGIYIYCREPANHAFWTSKINKIRCAVSDPTDLVSRLYRDIREFTSRWSFTSGGERSFQKAGSIPTEWYHLFIRAICHQHPEIRSNTEMLHECRSYYRNDNSTLKRINEFAQTYTRDKAIQYYTKDSFVYRILNHALRTQNMNVVRKFGPFIADIHSQLRKIHEDYIKQVSRDKQDPIRYVYRGQYMHKGEVEYISSVCKTRSSVITLTTFGSASLDPQVALDFIEGASFLDNTLVPCLFEIVIPDDDFLDPTVQANAIFAQPFANISSLSAMKDEQEILFSLGTYFRVKSVGEITKDRPWMPIELELTYRGEAKFGPSRFLIAKKVEDEEDPQMYDAILEMLQANASATEPNQTNWITWWNNLNHQWGTRVQTSRPVLLTLYEAFTSDKHWLRKAIELHKKILPKKYKLTDLTSSSSFLDVLREFYPDTQVIAFFEAYFQPFFTTNPSVTKETVEIFYLAGQAYETVHDTELASLCYHQALAVEIDPNNKTLSSATKRVLALGKSTQKKKGKPMHESAAAASEREQNNRLCQEYEAQEAQWSTFWDLIKDLKEQNSPEKSTKRRLWYLESYLTRREQWYNSCDLKNLLHLPFKSDIDVPVDKYRVYLMEVLHQHIDQPMHTVDATNHPTLTRWRYKKYMREWILLKELEVFLKPYQLKVDPAIYTLLDQLIAKLNVLITLCNIYLYVEQGSGKVNIKNMKIVDVKQLKRMKLVGFDHQDKEIKAELEVLPEREKPSTPNRCPELEIPVFEWFSV